MKTLRWAGAVGLLCGAAQAVGIAQAADLAPAPVEAPAASLPIWVTTLNTEFRYFSFSGTKGQPLGIAPTGVRGSGSQFYLPFGLGLNGQPNENLRIEMTVRGGYTDTQQTTPGLTGNIRTALDTQLSTTATYLGFNGFQPFLSLNFNLPTGTPFLDGQSFLARLDSDLVDIATFGEGLNVGPTLGVNVPIGDTMLFSIGVGYTYRGVYSREGVTDPITNITAATRLQPGDTVTANASLTYQSGPIFANLALVYMTEGSTKIDGVTSLRSGERISVSGQAAYTWSPEWTTTLSGSFTHAENNFVPGAIVGSLVREAFNSNSNLYRVGLDTLYTTGRVGIGPSLSYLYRDRNAFDTRTLLFVPQRERFGVGGVLQYAASDTVALSLRGERIFVQESANPDKIFDPFGIIPGTGQPRLTYRGWSISGGATIKF